MIPTNGAKMKKFWEVRVSSSKKNWMIWYGIALYWCQQILFYRDQTNTKIEWSQRGWIVFIHPPWMMPNLSTIHWLHFYSVVACNRDSTISLLLLIFICNFIFFHLFLIFSFFSFCFCISVLYWNYNYFSHIRRWPSQSYSICSIDFSQFCPICNWFCHFARRK